ncbi:MAG: hypothetical protein AB8B69_17520 [Chitinophagales bacterium]
MKFNYLIILILTCSFTSCENRSQSKKDATPIFKNKGHKLVYEMVQKVGTYETLTKKKDVVYSYTYETPDGKTDISTEKYIFAGGLCLGIYHKHERTLPQLSGEIIQGFDGGHFWLKHNDEYLQDSTMLERVSFNRKTNFYWFTMLPKLLDSSVNYEYIEEAKIDNKLYDVVKITFNSKKKKPTDIYQLYINQETSLVDQFLFTVIDFNVTEKPMLMQMQYEEIEGLSIPSKRQYKTSTWNAEISNDPWIKVTWSNIKFNNNLSQTEFNKP